MKQTTQPKKGQFNNLTKHLRSELDPQRKQLEEEKRAIEERLRNLPKAVSDETIMYAQAAGLTDLSRVISKIAVGLTPKQAVQVVAQDEFETRLESLRASLSEKSDAEVQELATEEGVAASTIGTHGETQELTRNQILISILRNREK